MVSETSASAAGANNLEGEDDDISITDSDDDPFALDQEFDVDCILAEKDDGNRKLYLIKWTGYDELESTWEPEEHIKPTIFEEWSDTKMRILRTNEAPFDFQAFEERKLKQEIERAERHRRSRAKRKHSSLLVSPFASEGEDLDDEFEAQLDTDDDAPSVAAEEINEAPADLPGMRRTSNSTFPAVKSSKKPTSPLSPSTSSSDIPLANLRLSHTQGSSRRASISDRETSLTSYQATSRSRQERPKRNIFGFKGFDKILPTASVGASFRDGATRGATRGGGASSGKYRNVFSRQGPPMRKRKTLAQQLVDKVQSSDTAVPLRHFKKTSTLRRAVKASRNISDAAPDISALPGGLYDPSKPFEALKPEDIRKQSEIEDSLFVGQDTLPANIRRAPAASLYQPSSRDPALDDRYHKICWYWYKRGKCTKRHDASSPCRYLHERLEGVSVAAEPLGVEDRLKQLCNHGSACSWKEKCEYFHPEDTLLNTTIVSAEAVSNDVKKEDSSCQVDTGNFQAQYTKTQEITQREVIPDSVKSMGQTQESKSASSHPQDTQGRLNMICYFWSTGNCHRGNVCRYHHEHRPDLPIAPAPGSQAAYTASDYDTQDAYRKYLFDTGKLICYYFDRFGACNRGSDCKFLHENDSSIPVAPRPGDRAAWEMNSNTSLKPFGQATEQSRNTRPGSDLISKPAVINQRYDSYRPEASTVRIAAPLLSANPQQKAELEPCVSSIKHEDEAYQPSRSAKRDEICYFWWSSSRCREGDNCLFHHQSVPNMRVAQRPLGNDVRRSSSAWSPRQLQQGSRDVYQTEKSLRKTEMICYFWNNGDCKARETCKYVHESVAGMPVAPRPGSREAPAAKKKVMCKFFVFGGPANCHLGDACNFSHDPETAEDGCSVQETCRYWLQGGCYNPGCRFVHRNTSEDRPLGSKDSLTGPRDLNAVSPLNKNSFAGPTTSVSFTQDKQTRLVAEPETFLYSEGNKALQSPTKTLPQSTSRPQIQSRHSTSSIIGSQNLQILTDRRSTLPDLPSLATTTQTFETSDLHIMQRFNQARGSQKHIVFGEDPKDAVLVKFGSLDQFAGQAWATTFGNLGHITLAQSCSAQDFHFHLASLVYQVYARGVLIPSPGAVNTFNRMLGYLKNVSSGLLFPHQSCSVLIYPSRLEEWNFLADSDFHGESSQFLYLIFRPGLGSKSTPRSSRYGQENLRRPKARTEIYRSLLVSKFHQLSLSTLLPGVADIANPCFYLIFPSTARSALAFLSTWLIAKKFDCKVLTSEQPGSWDWFLSYKDTPKVVLIYESAISTLPRIPSLQKLLIDSTQPTGFWYIDASLSSDMPLGLSMKQKHTPGGMATRQILPVHGVRGGAILLTPSFLMAEPEKALIFLQWFKSAVLEAPSGFWKLVCSSQMCQYLLDLAVEKATELKQFRIDNRDDDAMDANALKKGLSHEKCSQRFELYREFSEFITSGLAHGRTTKPDLFNLGTSLTDILDLWDGFHDDKYSDSTSNIIFADPEIDPDQEKSLAAWFAAWSLNNLGQFRRFIVVGTGGTIHADRAYRFKSLSDEVGLSPEEDTVSKKLAVQHTLKGRLNYSDGKSSTFRHDNMLDDENQVSAKRRKIDDETVPKKQLVSLEVTTSWYERQMNEGKGWGHIFVDQWEKAFNYLDPRLAAYVPKI
ncbi:hypothetical protein BP5796_01107 [Coleophoma crateriformis]|uniref:Chromo domain-containing protein n=1 Tax=Coleophoma crateriformis TaxID=565419 RepID=A0A3D8T9Z0_9HELO|nr:hypothetical protein BP5796_01107 [Coleophoma crateriformis]